MVIEPLSLIFLRVPSCAAAGSATARAAAMPVSSAKARFMSLSSDCWALYNAENSTLVDTGGHAAHALGDGGQQGDAEQRVRLDQVQEHRAVHGEQRAVGLG